MKALFVHQNCPGQFRYLAPHLANEPEHEVAFITQRNKPSIDKVRKLEYLPHRKVTERIHPYLVSTEAAVLNGQAVARLGLELKKSGYCPDVIVGNPGWGETLFLKDVWPDVPLVLLTEFFYNGCGADVGFDPEFDGGIDAILRARTRSGPHLLAINAADAAYAPTKWQRAQFPAVFQERIQVIHDGVDCDRAKPDEKATFPLGDGQVLSRTDEILTFVARNLEPYRGFHSFMRALPGILEARPDALVVVVGGDSVSYGSSPSSGGTWRKRLLAEVGPLPNRVHFVGRLPYDQYLSLLQVSSVHLYLTYPFVLSWSMLEAMAAGAAVVGSRTPPVEEVIEDGRNGRLVSFFDYAEIVETTVQMLSNRDRLSEMRRAARSTVLERFELSQCLSRQRELIEGIVSSR